MKKLMDGTGRRASVTMSLTCAIGLLGILIAAPSASGQAAIEQYIPQGNPAGGSGGASIGPSDSALGPGGAGPAHQIAAKPDSGSRSGGKLPFTDYPVTPFVWVVIAALLVGGLIRVAAPVLDRGGAKGA
jgi:hypothetical protein